MGLAIPLGTHSLRGLLTRTIGQVLPILGWSSSGGTPSSTPALVMTWGSDTGAGGSSRRDMDASKSRARSTATTVLGDMGLPGWITPWASVICFGDRTTSPTSRSMSGSDPEDS
ncbi:hypothetical protein PR003_g14931 [Phytophthora rubi]|uniref:Uncharacterized protein n=1 Tax=Phytophthora rubi TaxID=129364 RepID=A0A6A3LB14_9STRA|nr:hypothetical protein PR001_g19614 [Phytophthora rubi]KAE9013234.1 hypothetical protein PR002_g14572 [Phytophthora rubi]KAE9331596.1 hypothetical protein PR003_g14931 [Phytophthora rubi]